MALSETLEPSFIIDNLESMSVSDQITLGKIGLSKLETRNLRAWYGKNEAIKGINLQVPEKQITAVIGPSGCGKSTFLRCLNRMHEITPGARTEGEVILDG